MQIYIYIYIYIYIPLRVSDVFHYLQKDPVELERILQPILHWSVSVLVLCV